MKKITLTKEIYELYRELERLEDVLDFAFPYLLKDAFISDDYLAGFYFGDSYYEISKNNDNELYVFTNNITTRKKEVLIDEEVIELVNRLKTL